MKGLISKFLVFFILVSFSSCDFLAYTEDEKPEPPEVVTELNILTSDLTISEEGGFGMINFTCNGTWIASSGASWLTVSQANGFAGNIFLNFTAQENEAYDERNAVVTISCGNISKNITITQKQKNAILLTSDKIEVNAEGGDVTVEVKSNVSYTYEIEESAQEWISIASTRSLTTSSVHLNISSNNSSQVREGKIIFTDGNLKEVVTVYQQGQVCSLVLSQNEYDVSAKGDTIKVELQSNTNYTVEMQEVDWVREISSRAMMAYTHLFVIDENKESDARHCEIKFVNEESGIEESVKVSQNGKTIHVDKNEIRVSHEEQIIGINIDSSDDYTAIVYGSWIEPLDSIDSESGKLLFLVSKNESPFTERSAYIGIRGADGVILYYITIVQGHEYSVLVENTELMVGSKGGKVSFSVKSPVAYTAEVKNGADWISILNNSSAGVIPSELNLEVTENTTGSERYGIILITNSVTNETLEVSVIQQEK